MPLLLDILLDDRTDIGIEHGGTGTSVLTDLRQNINRKRQIRFGKLRANNFRCPALVLGIPVYKSQKKHMTPPPPVPPYR